MTITLVMDRYQREPITGDHMVVRIMSVDRECGARFECLEYQNLSGIVPLSELTRKKRVKSYRKICPIGSVQVVEVIDAGNGSTIASLRHVDTEERERVMERFNKNGRLISALTRFCHDEGLSLDTVYKDLVWPLLDAGSEGLSKHPYDQISMDTWSSEKYPALSKNHAKYFGGKKVHEIRTPLTIVFTRFNGLSHLKSLLSEFSENLRVDAVPNYVLTVCHDDQEQAQRLSEELVDKISERADIFSAGDPQIS